MIGGPWTGRPVKLAFGFRNGDIVDRRVTDHHQAVGIELPVLVAVGPEPISFAVAVFVAEPHSDAVVGVRPQFLDEAVIEFSIPLALQEGTYGVAACYELGPIPPHRVNGVRHLDSVRILRIPRIFGGADLLYG